MELRRDRAELLGLRLERIVTHVAFAVRERAHFGERDSVLPVDGVKRFAAAHPEVEVFIYAADHGFNCDQRGSYDAAAAALARERTLQHFRRWLG